MTETLPLPELLALWAQRYPAEVTHDDRFPVDVPAFCIHDASGRTAHVHAGRPLESFESYIVQGHARGCIEGAGWFHDTRSLPSGREDGEGVLYIARAENAGDYRHVVDAPDVQGQDAPTRVLVSLRLLLPPRTPL